MAQTKTITKVALVLTALVGSTFYVSANWGPRVSAASKKEQLVGTWKLVSRVIRHPDGSANPDPAYGPTFPIGYIVYDTTGHMAVQFMGLNRPSNHSSLGYEAYFGTYSVNESTNPPTVTHHMEGNLNPESVGKDVVRDLLLDGDNLTLVIHNDTPNVNVNTFTRVK